MKTEGSITHTDPHEAFSYPLTLCVKPITRRMANPRASVASPNHYHLSPHHSCLIIVVFLVRYDLKICAVYLDGGSADILDLVADDGFGA